MSRPRLARPAPRPHPDEPDLSPEHKAAVLAALAWAWGEVRRRWPGFVASASEEEITAAIAEVLNDHDGDDRRLAPGLSRFETVVRGAKVEAANGGIDYQPDLVFRPEPPRGVRNRGRWGWFVECKIVRAGATSIRLYCDEGVRRFVDRTYAAQMPSAAMLAYVRDGCLPQATLGPVLRGAYGAAVVEPPDAARPRQAHSRHERSATGAITLTHLWLDAR